MNNEHIHIELLGKDYALENINNEHMNIDYDLEYK